MQFSTPLALDITRRSSLPLPDRPSIAVLPFVDMSGEGDQEHFADGITEDLITGLSRIRWLFVIARNSTFQYKAKHPDVRQVGRELGVRYVLEGSVRRQGKRLRITAQLIDAIAGGHHWAERYDRELGDIFAVQDEITRSVAAVIEPRLLAAEGVRALARSADDLDAWELVARAQTRLWRMSKPDFEAAIGSLETTVESYPEYAPARSLLAFSLLFAVHMGWLDRARELRRGHEQALAATALDDHDAWGHIALGYEALMACRTEESIAAFKRAVDLNTNSAAARGHLGSRLGVFRTRSRSDPPLRRGHQAQPLRPDDGALSGQHCRQSLSCRALCREPSLRQRSGSGAPWFLRRTPPAVRKPGPNGARRGGAIPARNGADRAIAAFARLGSGKRALPNARTHGTLPGRHANGRSERKLRAASGHARQPRRALTKSGSPRPRTFGVATLTSDTGHIRTCGPAC